MSYIIRQARASDMDSVIQLAAASTPYSLSPLRDISTKKLIESRGEDLQKLKLLVGQPQVGIFVAEENSAFLGHVIVIVGAEESYTGEGQGWIFDMSVRPDYWGSGVAEMLAEKAEEFAKERGVSYVGLRVTCSNQRAIRFYEKSGYLEERKQFLKKI